MFHYFALCTAEGSQYLFSNKDISKTDINIYTPDKSKPLDIYEKMHLYKTKYG